MLLGSSTSHKVQVVVGTTGADIEISASVVVVSTASPPVVDGGATLPIVRPSVTTNATDDSVVGAASKITRVMEMQVRNNHASTTTDITVQRTDGTSTTTCYKATLLAGESLTYTGASTWLHYDVNGAIYPSVGNAATQAEMEAGTASNKYVTPQGVNWHPGACKSWSKTGVSGGVPSSTVGWNVTSITDSAVCRVTPVIATDFSSVNYCILCSFECNTTTYSATTTALIPTIRNATPTATQFTIDLLEIDIGQTTDPTTWFWACWGDQ